MALEKTATQLTEYEMFSEYQKTHDKKLRDELLLHYLYIPEILSRKFINRGIDYDDIYQVAVLGVLYAIERFDPKRGVQFATYATPTVLGEIRRYFRDMGNFIRVPRKLHEIFYQAEQLRFASGEKEHTPQELSRLLNISEETLKKAYAVGDAAFIRSLEDEAYADGQMNLASTIGMEDNHFIMIEDRDFIRSCMRQLSQEEQEFIRLRYYEELSQEQIAKKWNTSQAKISRFEKKLLQKLNRYYHHETDENAK